MTCDKSDAGHITQFAHSSGIIQINVYTSLSSAYPSRESIISCRNARLVLAGFCAHNICMSGMFCIRFSESLIRFYNQATLKIKGATKE